MNEPFELPTTLAEALAPEVLAGVVSALAPPAALRARGQAELEVESEADGTFVIEARDGEISAKKGFGAAPLVACALPPGGFAFVRAVVQDALAGFPRCPPLRAALAKIKAPPSGEADRRLAMLRRLPDVCVRLDVRGIGVFSVARGPIDEATRQLGVRVDGDAIRRFIDGGPAPRFSLDGDTSALSAILAVLTI